MRYGQWFAVDAVAAHHQPPRQALLQFQTGIDQPGEASLDVEVVGIAQQEGSQRWAF